MRFPRTHVQTKRFECRVCWNGWIYEHDITIPARLHGNPDYWHPEEHVDTQIEACAECGNDDINAIVEVEE